MSEPQHSPSAATLPAWARRWILEAEGGLSNDPDDKGGLTKFGISRRSHPDVDIANLTEDGAAAIYRAEYWDAIRGDELPPPLALVVFDAAVLQGVGTATRQLQRVLNAAGLDNIVADGVTGPRTIQGAIAVFAAHPLESLCQLLAERMVGLVELVEHAPRMRKFLLGWTRRLFRLGATAAGLKA